MNHRLVAIWMLSICWIAGTFTFSPEALAQDRQSTLAASIDLRSESDVYFPKRFIKARLQFDEPDGSEFRIILLDTKSPTLNGHFWLKALDHFAGPRFAITGMCSGGRRQKGWTRSVCFVTSNKNPANPQDFHDAITGLETALSIKLNDRVELMLDPTGDVVREPIYIWRHPSINELKVQPRDRKSGPK